YTITYYTTAAQEEELTTVLATVLTSLDMDSKDEVEKIDAIYEYICSNVTYDYTHVSDSSYKLQYTAYAALINKTAVCQGYCVLFYRMALEAGLDVRIISGNSSSHGWNIVKLGDYYYNVDATWDAANYSYGSYYYFLRCDANFDSHIRDNSYSTTDFHATYPMAESDYPCPYGHNYGFVVTDPTCTEGGCTTYTCSVCGNTYTGDETDALGHSYVSEITKEATESEAGVITYTCTNCGASYTENYYLYVLGDVNDDGKVNTRDIILVSQYLAGLVELSIQDAADVNGDGKINTRDLILISQYVAGLVTSF
ncbi:MAG: dockerin type I domain-containing protein, partial [Oscillospiraceae bacterium]|nr:dockerin type I domain-containing protein [Oscillospiraceae bacterium]